jgi:trehalose-6-phosphate synthase
MHSGSRQYVFISEEQMQYQYEDAVHAVLWYIIHKTVFLDIFKDKNYVQ